jgi:hypothetical protein
MIGRARPSWDRQLAGLQVGVFEALWPGFDWLRAIWVRRGAGRVHFHVQAAALPNDEERDAFGDLIGVLVEAGREVDPASFRSGFTIRYGLRRVPRGVGYRIVMSDRVFREIARKRAPWRLANGRQINRVPCRRS